MLGPHVVGQRIVVRRILPGETGPTGGPAFTDLLGTCLAWADGTCVVQAEDGTTTAIATADIVSGKPVPPRPSTRHRVTPAEAQRRALALWPDLHTEPLGDWVLRHSATSTARRANSVLAMGPSGAEDDYDRVLAFYAGRTGRPIAAVLPDSAEDAMFRSHGWGLESNDADTLFQLGSVARALRGLDVPDAAYDEEGDLVTVRVGDHARGVAAYADDWVGLRGIEVDPDRRRQGLGLAVVAALLEWGAERGATTAYLQVLGDNAPALALYASLGFTTHHAYRYVAPS
ncbi:GNAT family N-acetyltransferase [Nocardioides sp. MAH-18]|uniref:GNAT family N-acetyltransferase n=1 Tax=Nocardioides agri TaxID=2682843 RepID=A0A6L6XWQ1_9ACTN|nr:MULTISPECIES: GNAT family N-acetyltransferase [unclassified Nocardioides]MBA2956049.1 GNAT family N-acetyltransferase [Nocardioides sp. CGMCC 1.13656]MVQ50896.1 GNAT family N-acetyltransferase [Nocardioides sp. MAH-18]